MNFVSDQLSNRRRFRVLNVVDDYSRGTIGQRVSVSGQRVVRFLNQLAEKRSFPPIIVRYNGPELISEALFFWAKEGNTEPGFT